MRVRGVRWYHAIVRAPCFGGWTAERRCKSEEGGQLTADQGRNLMHVALFALLILAYLIVKRGPAALAAAFAVLPIQLALGCNRTRERSEHMEGSETHVALHRRCNTPSPNGAQPSMPSTKHSVSSVIAPYEEEMPGWCHGWCCGVGSGVGSACTLGCRRRAAGAHLPAQLNDLRHRHLVALLFVRNCGSENHQAAQQPGGVVGAPDDHDGACTVADPSAPW